MAHARDGDCYGNFEAERDGVLEAIDTLVNWEWSLRKEKKMWCAKHVLLDSTGLVKIQPKSRILVLVYFPPKPSVKYPITKRISKIQPDFVHQTGPYGV